MKIEILFPEIAGLYGDLSNVKYLGQCLKDAEIVYTNLDKEPSFVSEEISMIYMGGMTEKKQEIVIEKLMPYKEAILEQIKKNTIFLVTGNALEIFGSYIEKDDKSQIEGLGIFSIYAKREMFNRYDSLVLGEFEDMKIVGFKSQFSHSYGDNKEKKFDEYFYKVIRGAGLNPDSDLEGIRRNNFFGTYTLGPLLVLNPYFTKYLLKLLGVEEPVLAFEEANIDAYETRLAEFEKETIKFSY
ncbi:MAG: hypothetical protein GX913_08890 [Clostridiales bacterium]|nr:hypothetical protein [Clostridiales bacterium]